jgi:hypothetical protein
VGTFTNVHFGTITPTYVTVLHDHGGARVYMTNLPEWLQKKLGYSPESSQPPKTNVVDLQFVPQPETNSVSKQFEAAASAMTSYFEFKKDDVTGEVKIDQPDYDVIAGGDGVGVELVCLLKENQEFPSTVTFHVHSESSEWRFLDYHAMAVRADNMKKDFGEPNDYSKVVYGGVTEGFLLDWTLDELHDFAWSNDFVFKIGTSNFRVSAEQRQKWKLLWKYFSLKRQMSADKLKSIIGN